MKKQWIMPEIADLSIDKTEHGKEVSTKIDGVWTDPDNGDKWYSFENPS